MRLKIRLEPIENDRFTHRIAFEDLSEKIKKLGGYTVKQVATGSRERPAFSAGIKEPHVSCELLECNNIFLRVQPIDNHETLNCRIAFVGLVEALHDKGVTIRACESRENGRGTPAALRFNLYPYNDSREEIDDPADPADSSCR